MIAIPKSFTEIRLSEVLAALSYTLDNTEVQPQGHFVRNCLIGMSLGSQNLVGGLIRFSRGPSLVEIMSTADQL
ncbi:MAG: hypothetical protein QGM50_00395 [Anaerolineae bacterium]|nr:hypothetical protein [Anaerolineae bacterium]MDK1079997.1 hypothetical protein [Anaerolineae bacterium]MDK1117224.1 hypothetical protein [Anaerolineae bacterium]